MVLWAPGFRHGHIFEKEFLGMEVCQAYEYASRAAPPCAKAFFVSYIFYIYFFILWYMRNEPQRSRWLAFLARPDEIKPLSVVRMLSLSASLCVRSRLLQERAPRFSGMQWLARLHYLGPGWLDKSKLGRE